MCTELDLRSSVRWYEFVRLKFSEYEDSRVAEQELLVTDGIVVPSAKEYRLQAINDTLLFPKVVDRMRPELSDKLDD